jgi:tripartite-type tricarboxylate transporter receptor subunit TctC
MSAMRGARRLAVVAVLVVAAAPPAFAQGTGHEIRFVVGYPAGSGADSIVRWCAEKLRARFDKPLIVENKPGAFTNIATEYVARARPDGHTIYFNGGGAIAANMYLLNHPTVDGAKAFQIVATLNRQPTMVAVAVQQPYKTMAELTAGMKRKGKDATYGVSFVTGKVIAGIYKQIADLPDMVEVNYKTANEARVDILKGGLDFVITDPVFSSREESAGMLRILGIASGARTKVRPDLPTLAEQGIPMDLVGWWAAMVPAETPKPLVDQLNGWFNEIVDSEDGKKFFNSFGSDPWTTTPEQGQAEFLKEIEKWGKIVHTVKLEKFG